MGRKTLDHKPGTLGAAGLALALFLLACLAGPGRGEQALGQLKAPANLNAAAVPASAVPAAPPESDAPAAASFARISKLVRAAKKSVNLTTLAFPGDETGRRMAGLLIAGKKAGRSVLLLIDKNTARLYDKTLLAELAAAGIPARFYLPADGAADAPQTRMLVIDGKCAVFGGKEAGRKPSGAAGAQKIRSIDAPVQVSATDNRIVFFFQATDNTEPAQKIRDIQAPAQPSATDNGIVFFFQATDNPDTKQ